MVSCSHRAQHFEADAKAFPCGVDVAQQRFAQRLEVTLSDQLPGRRQRFRRPVVVHVTVGQRQAPQTLRMALALRGASFAMGQQIDGDAAALILHPVDRTGGR
jgi:hypothetical protein